LVNSPSGARSGFVLLAIGLAGVAGAGFLVRQRAASDAGARQQAGEITRALEENVAGLKAGLGQEADQAADIPQIRSALANRADPVTFQDLFQHEDWWDPYRSRAAAIVVGDDVIVTQLLDPATAREGAQRARGAAGTSLQALEVRGATFLVAVSSHQLPRAGFVYALLIGRQADRTLLEKLRAGPATALALSDGRRIRTSTGDAELGALASTLVGRETEASLAPAGGDWTAATVPVADKLWVIGLAHRAGNGVPMAGVIGSAGAGALLALAGLIIVVRGRKRRPEDELPAAPAAAPGLAHHTPSERAPSGAAAVQPRLSVVPRPTPVPPPSSPGGGLAAATALAAEGGQQFGRYRLIERIGEGGMAEVFTAMLSGAEGFERMVVIKRLRPHLALNPDAVAQFIDEAKLGSALAHSNIVTVSDFGKVGDGFYLAQEFVDGRTLAQIAARYHEKHSRTVPTAIVFHVVHEVLGGIGYAHERMDTQGRPLGIVHRDVSPTNIMISFEGEVKLLDFGIVKATERVSKTKEGNVKGNVGYMSPEQARGLDATPRSDLFSLGLVMFELLSGEPFYQGAGAGEILYQAATGPTVDHWGRIAKLPPPAPEILRKVLAMDPASRFVSARAFAHELASATMLKGQLAEMMRSLFR
jgi:Protein kinase domain